jgi:uncharacterized membrane protein (DUF2068 family)
MYCVHCGARIEEGQTFCSSCGKPVGTMAAAPAAPVTYQARVARHVQVVAILWLVWSVLRLARGAGFLFFGRFGLHLPFHIIPFSGPAWIFPFTTLIGITSVGYAVVGFIAAWGLFQRLQWARILTLVIAFLSLINIPFGTALGIYTLWVFLPAQSGEEYRGMCPPA